MFVAHFNEAIALFNRSCKHSPVLTVNSSKVFHLLTAIRPVVVIIPVRIRFCGIGVFVCTPAPVLETYFDNIVKVRPLVVCIFPRNIAIIKFSPGLSVDIFFAHSEANFATHLIKDQDFWSALCTLFMNDVTRITARVC